MLYSNANKKFQADTLRLRTVRNQDKLKEYAYCICFFFERILDFITLNLNSMLAIVMLARPHDLRAIPIDRMRFISYGNSYVYTFKMFFLIYSMDHVDRQCTTVTFAFMCVVCTDV